MSLQEVREQNIALVTQTALACFVENGIDKTTIRDIAHRAGLTERSVYRYFATKDELVVAAAFLYWDRAKAQAAQGLIFTDPAGIRFSLDAEVALCNAGRQHAVVNRPPERFEVAPGPIAAAIRRGLADGTVDTDADVKMLYYNAYDAILGVIQRMSVGVPSVHELDGHARIDALCEQFTRAFAAPPPGEKGTGNTF